LIGLAAGAELDLLAFLTSKYFGTAHYAAIFGAILAFFTFAGGIGPPVFGAMAQAYGGYTVVHDIGVNKVTDRSDESVVSFKLTSADFDPLENALVLTDVSVRKLEGLRLIEPVQVAETTFAVKSDSLTFKSLTIGNFGREDKRSTFPPIIRNYTRAPKTSN